MAPRGAAQAVYRAEVRIGSDVLHVAPNVEWVPDGPYADYRNQVQTPGYALLGVTGGAAESPAQIQDPPA